MTWELGVWLASALIGMLFLPFVIRRRIDEHTYLCSLNEPAPMRSGLHKARTTRSVILSLGVVLAALVVFVNFLLDPDELRRLVQIILLIGVLWCLVGALVADELFSAQIDRIGRK